MRTLGLIGGMSWESTIPYYRHINETVKIVRGGLHSARIILYSVNFDEIEKLQHAGRWDEAGAELADVAVRLESAGADGLVLCTNTMHRVASVIESAVGIPLLHIADPTALALKEAGYTRVGLLGTRFTMEHQFYRGRLQQEHGLEVLIPDANDRDELHRIIYDELCQGLIREESRSVYVSIINRLKDEGAEAVILGCTEISLLVKPQHIEGTPLFDTTSLHAIYAAQWALDT